MNGDKLVPARHRRADAMPARRDRQIRCRDLAGRRRELILFADNDRIVLVVPDGETAVLTMPQAGQLRAALRDTTDEAGSF